MNIEILRSNISDNYFYLVSDEAGRAALIDPVDAETAIATVREGGFELEYVINTHFHHDHVGGNDAVLEAFPQANLLAGPDAERIEGDHPVDKTLKGGEELHVGGLLAKVLDTPGHTPGHISLLVEDHLFSGDTIFVGGAGNCSFGGDPGVLFRTFRGPLAELGDDVTFYPGHDYARRNLEFALEIEPDNSTARSLLASLDDEPGIFLSTLGQERGYSPFFRWDDPALRQALRTRHAEDLNTESTRSESEAEAVFRTVRALRNNW